MDVRYTVILEPDAGAFNVIVPALPEVATFGKTPEEALAMAREAIQAVLEDRTAHGEEIPPSDVGTARIETVAISLPAA
ncbi:type II toxin-antitoxin system HicB family antitoxin [bacterium]|nr:MAG: type II toxin-antitoxin system HicB family antitoxin [bacterium]